jgi:hypothetical protein
MYKPIIDYDKIKNKLHINNWLVVISSTVTHGSILDELSHSSLLIQKMIFFHIIFLCNDTWNFIFFKFGGCLMIDTKTCSMKSMNGINLNIYPFIANTKMITLLEYLSPWMNNKDVYKELTPIKVRSLFVLLIFWSVHTKWPLEGTIAQDLGVTQLSKFLTQGSL